MDTNKLFTDTAASAREAAAETLAHWTTYDAPKDFTGRYLVSCGERTTRLSPDPTCPTCKAAQTAYEDLRF